MLTPDQRRAGQRTLRRFGVFNAASFSLLTGNLISLYALQLGATTSYVGLISAFGFASFFFLLVGKSLVPRFGVMRLLGWAWLLRYIAILPIMLAPLAVPLIGRSGALVVVAAAMFGFHAFRGIGIISNAPMFSGFATEADRGRLISSFQTSASIVSIAVGAGVAFLLGPTAAIGRYVVFLAAGVAAGMVAVGLVFSLPELESERGHATIPLRETARSALTDPRLRDFLVVLALIALTVGIGRSFLVVWVKQAWELSDRAAYILVTAGSFGNLVTGLLGATLLDRLGAKPLVVFSQVALLVSLAAAVLVPASLLGPTALIATGAVIFLVAMLGITTAESSAQAYFFGITRDDQRLGLGVIYFSILGAGGTLGALLGGTVIDALSLFLERAAAYRIFWMLVIGLLTLTLWRILRLASLGAETFRGALEVIFSPRDLRAAAILNRLDRVRTEDEEQSTLRELAQSGSPLAVDDIVERLHAPSFAVRTQAIEALSVLPYSPAIERALIAHLQQAPHTTAAQAARLLGRASGEEPKKALLRALDSDDRWLAGLALVSLASLDRQSARTRAREWLSSHEVAIDLFHAAVALQVAGEEADCASLEPLFRRPELEPYVVDEGVLALFRMTNLYDRLYPLYSAWLRPSAAAERMSDDIHPEHPAWIRDAVTRAEAGEAAAVLGIVSANAVAIASLDPARLAPRPRVAWILAALALYRPDLVTTAT